MACHFGSRMRTLIHKDLKELSFSWFRPLFFHTRPCSNGWHFLWFYFAWLWCDHGRGPWPGYHHIYGAEAESAQLATDRDEMAILADYIIPPAKTPDNLAKDLKAMVSGVNTLPLQAQEGTTVVVALWLWQLLLPRHLRARSCGLPVAWWVLPRLLPHRRPHWNRRLRRQLQSLLLGQPLHALISQWRRHLRMLRPCPQTPKSTFSCPTTEIRRGQAVPRTGSSTTEVPNNLGIQGRTHHD